MSNSRTNILSFFSIVGFLLVWQVISYYKFVDPLFIGKPTQIFTEGLGLFKTGGTYEHLILSLKTFILGFSLALVFGVIVGLFLGAYSNAYQIVKPYLFALNSLPTMVILPLIIIWFGIGLKAKTIVVFMMSVVPILVNTIDGVRSVSEPLIKMAQSFKAKKIFIIRNIIFQSTLPYIFSGARVALGRAVLAVVIAEYLGLGNGIGYLLSYYGATFQVNKVMALVFLIILFNLGILRILNIGESKLVYWKEF